ncbi:hypothetical protein OUZ56_000767 [Daphnia magna]|uniref:Secreted protein n=1 Tax=Daphnia magna TaxID=35525 RepID=A0ABR0A0P5_9CRUS|nr:hypothetical protein OUZ56_000767 [Daphnia magna]
MKAKNRYDIRILLLLFFRVFGKNHNCFSGVAIFPLSRYCCDGNGARLKSFKLRVVQSFTISTQRDMRD